MDAYIVTDMFNNISLAGARRFSNSITKGPYANLHSIDNFFIYPQPGPGSFENSVKKIKNLKDPESIKWSWPGKKLIDEYDIESGFIKPFLHNHSYTDLIYQSLAHIKLWDYCIELDRPILVINSNIKMSKAIDYEQIKQQGFKEGIVGISVRNSETYNADYIDQRIQELEIHRKDGVVIGNPSVVFYEYPYKMQIPFLGHGAYIITPWGAKKGLELVEEHGLQPIQFLLCNQYAPWTKIVWPELCDASGGYSTVWKMKK